MVFKKIRCGASGHGNLIGQTPNHDTWMIVILCDQLFHLGNSIFPSCVHMIRDIRNLCPDYKTFLIAQIIEILIMLIMCQTDGCSTHLTDQFDIFFVMFREQCISQTPAVLMAGYTTQRIAFSIQNEAFIRINFKSTAAKTCAYSIQNFFALFQRNFCSIQIGIFSSIPQMNLWNRKYLCGIICSFFYLRNHISILIF